MVTEECQHDGGLVIGVEIGPVHGHHDGSAGTDNEGHPAHQDVVDLNGWIGEQAIDLLDRVFRLQTSCGSKALADGADCQTTAVQQAKSSVA